MNRSYIKLFFVLLISAIPACKSVEKGKNGDKPKPVSGELTKSEKIINTALFIDANNEKIHGNYKKAEKLFSQCIDGNPKNAAAMYEMAKILRFHMQFDAALTYARQAKRLYPENIWYQQLLADVYKDLNRHGEAVKIYKDLVKKHPDNIDFYGKWAMFYILQAKYDDAIKIYNTI